jgi:coniferyl-aldehyde dehydrogenase
MSQAIRYDAKPVASAVSPTDTTELRSTFDRIRAASRGGPPPAYGERMERLERLANAVKNRMEEIVAAVRTDFGSRSAHETKLAEVVMLLDAIK